MATTQQHFRADADPRELPAYTIPEAAHYLRLAVTTLRSWVVGQRYLHDGRRRDYEPLIHMCDVEGYRLSFMNLVEAHVLKAIRRDHDVSMQTVRPALAWLAREYPSKHPLADNSFATVGKALFVERYGSLIDLSGSPQTAMKEILEVYLRRIRRDATGAPIKLFPFSRKVETQDPSSIEVDPYIAFGRPVLAGTGIPTELIAERYKAGDSMKELADDYGRSEEEIEEAIRCELNLQAA